VLVGRVASRHAFSTENVATMGRGMPPVTASTVPIKTAVALVTCRDKGASPAQPQASAGEECVRTQTPTQRTAAKRRRLFMSQLWCWRPAFMIACPPLQLATGPAVRRPGPALEGDLHHYATSTGTSRRSSPMGRAPVAGGNRDGP
jgi:hypothetical protein